MLRAIAKYGLQNFSRETLCLCGTKEDATNKERFFIKQLKPDYNIAQGGVGGNWTSYKDTNPEEYKRIILAISKKLKNKTQYVTTSEIKLKISNTLKKYFETNPSPMLNKKHRKETLAKISLASITAWQKPGYREKMSKIRKGRIASEETRLKMSLAAKGVKKSRKAVLKSLESRRGYKHSEETKNKMKEAWKRRKANEIS